MLCSHQLASFRQFLMFTWCPTVLWKPEVPTPRWAVCSLALSVSWHSQSTVLGLPSSSQLYFKGNISSSLPGTLEAVLALEACPLLKQKDTFSRSSLSQHPWERLLRIQLTAFPNSNARNKRPLWKPCGIGDRKQSRENPPTHWFFCATVRNLLIEWCFSMWGNLVSRFPC